MEMKVKKGQVVDAGNELFVLETDEEEYEKSRAEQRLEEARGELADLLKGRRQPEIAVLEQQLAQAKATAWHSRQQYNRDKAIIKSKGVSQADLEKSQSEHERNEAKVLELMRQLDVARLPGREDIVAAKQAEARAAEVAMDLAKWRIAQKKPVSPRSGIVTDIIYRTGELVRAGSPVVQILPPENVKVRFFVPEGIFSKTGMLQKAHAIVDGINEPVELVVEYISPKAEYTPPVIYSNETRSKLVFMIEARPVDSKVELHPGQPLKVLLP